MDTAAFDALLRQGKSLLRGAVDFAFPDRCLACGALGPDRDRRLCVDCRARVSPLPAPSCARCAMPVARPLGKRKAARCAACRSSPPPFRRTVAGAAYDGVVRDLVLALKFGRDRLAALPLAALLAAAIRRADLGAPLRPGADAVVPLPLSRRRRRERGFNQAELVARAVARALGLPLRPSWLARLRDAPPQSLAPTRVARRANVAGVFLARVPLRPGRRAPRVLLVDDVMTTGATVEAASRALRAAGCAEVIVAVAGRAI